MPAALKWPLQIGGGVMALLLFTTACVLAGAMLGSVWRTASIERRNVARTVAIDAARPITASVWLPPAGGPARAPLVVYMPGYQSGRLNNVDLLHTLSLRGYLVVAVDDIFHDAPYDAPDDEAARLAVFDYSSDASVQRFIALADRRAMLQAHKIISLLDGLGRDPALGSRIDFDKIGMIGGSFGGAAAALVARRDPRIKAAVNLDGWQFGFALDDIIERPYLAINSCEAHFTSRDLASADVQLRNEARLNELEYERQRRQAAARSDTYRYLTPGGSHNDLTDALRGRRRLMNWWIARATGVPMPDAAALRIALDELIGTFLDVHVRGLGLVPVRAAAARFRELTDLGRDGKP